ncbi:MAG: phosphoenolpyruvate synthase [Nanoarchaeota archaeon]|nr:phosphoenolpyruvate synthase [Nanoarchaeota archaeon]
MKEKEADKHIRWFSELGKDDIKTVGGKGANLGEMTKLKLPIPPGFCILTSGYQEFLQDTDIDAEIYNILNKTDVDNTSELEQASARIKKRIIDAEMPKELEEEITDNYEALNLDVETIGKAGSEALSILKKAYEPIFVAVRSSATAEDSSEASFAGQQETFLNIKGKSNVIEAVKKCWASLFTARSIYYRIKKGFKHEQVLISVIIMKMINSDKSGVIFSKNPVGDDDNIVIEAVYGLGEGIVSGRISPDHYEVSRDMKIEDIRKENKKIALTRNSSGENTIINLTEEKSKSQVLTEQEILRLAKYSIRLEEHYKKPQDIEFAIDSGEIFIVQTRPITTLNLKQRKQEISGKEILTGVGASPGIGSGTVRIVKTKSDLEKIKKGDVLVTKMTNPDMVVAMQKSAAIITDEGGLTSHAAIISREMGIPAVIGTDRATSILKDNQKVTVNGFAGKIYEGIQEKVEAEILPIVKTKTNIKVIVDLPDYAERAAKTKITHVGLTRIEGIIAESGKHPLYFWRENKLKDYENIIFKGIKEIANHFEEVWVRTSDIRTDEYKNLQGAPKEVELNPMLGFHGIRFSLKKPEILRAELLALKRVAEEGKKRIGIMMPQIISVQEVQETKKILEDIKFTHAKLGVMIETPAAVQIIEDLCKQRIEFISFGTNDLTQYTLAIDRGNEHIQYLYDETHPAVLSQISSVIQVCKKYNVETSICGQAGSNRKMAEFLVSQGIDSISVNADKANEISILVQELESKGLISQESREIQTGEDKMPSENTEINEIDDTKHLKEELEEKASQVKEENKERAEEWKKQEDNIEVEEKTPKELEKEREDKKKSDEFPEVDIGIDIFSQQ